MKPAVSVIVPVYKVEPYLVRCLDSLQNQKLTNIEIILVDDGSPDRCGEICDTYAISDVRFRVFHQKHAGTSVARNLGIRMATSEYLMFVDSDDWVHENFCKDAFECAIHYQAEVVVFSFQRVINSKLFGLQYKKSNSIAEGFISREKLIDHLVKYGSSSCNKLFHKSLFNTVKFPEGYYYEDVILYKVIYNAKRIYSLNRSLYYYYYRPGSTVTLRSSKVCKDRFEMYYKRLQDLARWKVFSAERIDFELKRIALIYCLREKENVLDPYYLFSSQILQSTNVFTTDFTWKQKTMIVLFKYWQPLFEFICNVYGKRDNH